MGTFITTLAEYLWVLCIGSLLLSLVWSASKSARITILILTLSGLAQDRIAPLLMGISDTSPELARLLWYPSWVICQTLTLGIIWVIHRKFVWAVEQITQFICLSILMHSVLQVARFTDRVIFGTDLLGGIYKYGIPAINIAAILAIFLWSISGAVKHRKELQEC